MPRHDEPNEYGFAGDPTLPEPPRPHGREEAEEEAAEDVAVPGSDVPTEITEALEEIEGKPRERRD